MPLERIELTAQQLLRLRVIQVVCASLVVGPLAVVVLALAAQTPPKDAGNTQLFLMINAGVSASLVVAGVFVPRIMMSKRTSGATNDPVQHYLASALVACTLQEGGAVYAAVNMLLTGDFIFWALLVPHLALMAICVPTRSRLEMHLDRLQRG